jgi:hypothetical protein
MVALFVANAIVERADNAVAYANLREESLRASWFAIDTACSVISM